MLAAVTLSLALQVSVGVGMTRQDSLQQQRRDSLSVMIEESMRNSRRDRGPAHRDSVTPELERSAFKDASARELLHRAREARLRQDSSLQSYDAKVYQRISVGMGLRKLGRDRLLFRSEIASRVRWSRTGGAWVDLTGRRAVMPSFGAGSADADIGDMSPLPYYPGKEELWVGSTELARAEVDDRELVHPIATGSEAYYRYSSGDSLIFTLPDGSRITLRELRVEPRRPEWRLSVGSFWFDAASGQLVRAVYRFAVPMDIWAVADEESARNRKEGGDDDDDVPGWVKGMMSPLKANLEAVTIEYGLFGGRFWLPTSQYADATAQAGIMRIPVRVEEAFSYGSVNGPEILPPVPEPPKSLRDSLFPDDTGSWRDLPAEERRSRNDAIRKAAAERGRARRLQRERECQESGSYTTYRERFEGTLRVGVKVPCDSAALIHSPDLAESIYDPGEELFGTAQRDELLKALDFGLQSAWAPQRPRWQYGLGMTRYNRVEGLSTGLSGEMELGGGYALDMSARLGLGDHRPGAELGVTRSNGRTDWRLGGFLRLQPASEWGTPFSLGSSLEALFLGRDDGFYYRASGLELTRGSTAGGGGGFTTRFFAERQRTADATTSFSVAKLLGSGTRFGENIRAEDGSAFGMAVRDVHTLGLNPQSWRLFSDLRLEGGWFSPASDVSGARGFGRAALDVTLSRGLGERAAAALTLGAGVTHEAPLQRQFILGGVETVRGQRPGAAMGESYWLSRLELGRGTPAGRLVAFADVGWAGPRSMWTRPGRVLSGAGLGLSFMDGLMRLDLARGIHPSRGYRLEMYLDSRF